MASRWCQTGTRSVRNASKGHVELVFSLPTWRGARMADVTQKRANRPRIMMMIYEAAEGSRLNWVSGQWLLDASGLPDEDLGDICEYLKSERMIEVLQTLWGHATPYQMRLTHRGIKEMENTATEPPLR